MELIDIFIGFVLLFEIFKGLKKGFLVEAGSILGIIIGLYAAFAFGVPMSNFIGLFFSVSERWLSVLGFFFAFLVVFSIIVILAKIFEGIMSAVALGWVNRFAGGLFCFFKGVLVLSIFLNLYEAIDEDRSFIGADYIETSKFYKPVLKVAPKLFPSFKSIIGFYEKEKPGQNEAHKILV